ncbi:two-CW domain-containing protein [Candidatus Riflebacteria bacterium]
MKKNCWEANDCRRQPGGVKVSELGVCPAAESNEFDGINDGKFAGRYCWKLAGTLCNGEVQGTFALKLDNCIKCNFYKQIRKEEGKHFQY